MNQQEGNEYALFLSDDQYSIIVENHQRYKRCKISFETAHSNMTLFKEPINLSIFKKIIC